MTRERVLKLDSDRRIVVGEVYAPDLADTEGDFMSAENIEKMAHDFMKKMGNYQVDLMHDHDLTGCYVIESFIAREGDPTFIAGSWVVAVKVESDEIWEDIKAGRINGFSFEGAVTAQKVEVEIEVPEYIDGVTDERDGHRHKFRVRYDEQGNYLGGETDTVDGHFHQIVRSTVTREAQGHNHRFSYLEQLV